jgi:hypothetical protein
VSGASTQPSISANGRWIAFRSTASSLVAGDTNGAPDVFVRDMLLGANELVSVDSAGLQSNGASDWPAISSDGRYVAFESAASNLVPGDTNGVLDVFVHDRLTGLCLRASVSSAGAQASEDSSRASISADGRWVCFRSAAAELVPGDAYGAIVIFEHDLRYARTLRASVAGDGSQADAESRVGVIAADGRHIAFASRGDNLVPGDTNLRSDVFLRDRGREDCDHDGVEDPLEISLGSAPDCDGNWVPDACQLVPGSADDCDGDGLVDACEIAANPALDADLDGILDSCPSECLPTWDNRVALAGGFDGSIVALAVFDDGNGPKLYAGGFFHQAGGLPAEGIACWDGTSWQALGAGLSGGAVWALAVFDDGTGPALFAGGSFTSAGGLPAAGLARWDGSTWTPLGIPTLGLVCSFAVFDCGAGAELVLGSDSGVYHWNGATLAQIPYPQIPMGYTRWLAVFDDGAGAALYIGGTVIIDMPTVVRWTPAGGVVIVSGYGDGTVTSIAVGDDGTGQRLYYSAGSQSGEGLWEHSAGNWVVAAQLTAEYLGSSAFVRVLETFDDGSGPRLYAGGGFTGVDGRLASNVAVRDHGAWSRLGVGADSYVTCMCRFDDGDGPSLFMGGPFARMGNLPSPSIARWGPRRSCSPRAGSSFCEPGGYQTQACPCLNPPVASGRGCGNSSGSGAALSASGAASVSADSIVFRASSEPASATSILLQSSFANPAGVFLGQGVRCLLGPTLRLYVKSAVGGVVLAPAPGDASVSARSAALGDVLAQGAHRYYGVYYRDPVVLGGCPAGSTFNITQQLDVVWHP